MKSCVKCRVEKSIDDFHLDKSKDDGHCLTCKKCAIARASKWRLENLERHLLIARQYSRNHKEEMSVRCKKWYEKYKSRHANTTKKWRTKNYAYILERNANRKAKRINATPKWANIFFIREAYDLAKRRSKSFGFPWHVDHIVPLKSKLVCGLHCEHNISVIPGSVNLSKNNRFWPDMP